MADAFGDRQLKPGQYVWRDVPDAAGPQRVVISLSDQMAYLYRGDELVAATTISSGRDDKPTPTGIFSILNKTPMYRSKKYDNAAMPYAEFFEPHGIALHAGAVGNEPNSHGCVHLPSAFAKKLYSVTDIGTPVYHRRVTCRGGRVWQRRGPCFRPAATRAYVPILNNCPSAERLKHCCQYLF